jgi:predicted  nucleic acid-binding Zn-ribbon protein
MVFMMAEQTQQIADLEGTVTSLERREKRLRAILSSFMTSNERRHSAREELESLLDQSEQAEEKLSLLQFTDGVEKYQQDSAENRAGSCRQPRTILSNRFGRQ